MPARFLTLAIALLVCVGVPHRARAQTPPARHAGPRIGVALSGGGARGLAHIGVLRALERAGVPIDAVAGTSMGSLVGGLYASGYNAAQLDSIARAIDWRYMFTDAPDVPRQEPFATIRGNATLLSLPMHQGHVALPSGVVAGQHVSTLLTRLTWPVRGVRRFRDLSIPFSAVATDITTGEAVVLDTGSLAGAMRASMSLPSVFAPAPLDGRVLIDGGISRNLPAQDVRALGADVVICSDVSEPLLDSRDLLTIVDVLNQVVSFHGFASTLEERRRCDLYVRPDLTGLGYLSFDHIDDWIARGDSATRAITEQLRELVARSGGAARAPMGIDAERRTAPVTIRGTVVRAPTRDAEAFVASMLDLAPPTVVDPARLERETEATYASGLFETVTYSIVSTDSGNVVVIDARGDNADRVDFGFRYDDRYNAALLFNATFRHLLGFASTGRMSLRLGEQTRVALDVARGRTLRSRWVLGMGASYLSTPLDFYSDGHRAAEATLRVGSVTATAGAAVGNAAMALQVKGEDAWSTSSIAAVDSSAQRMYGTAAALLWWDHMNEDAFPTRGSTLMARYERGVGGGAPFSRRFVATSVAIPMTGAVTLHGHAAFGATSPDSTIPAHYRFYLGGLTPSAVLGDAQMPFAGLRVQERNDFAVALAGADMQVEVVRNVFVTTRMDVGNVAATVSDAVRARIVGAGLGVGTRTIAGPIEVRVHGRSVESAVMEFSAGYLF